MKYLVGFACVLWGSGVARAACPDSAAVMAVRAMADAQCCATATSHREYLKCVAGVVKSSVTSGSLPKQCKRSVMTCAVKSTCGRSGFVSCCRSDAQGATKCSIKPSAAKCTAPKGGAACVGSAPSCCDACAAGSCPLTTTTTMPAGPVMPKTVTVKVGQDGFSFTPMTVDLNAGDTVHWVWSSGGHDVVSGTSGSADGKFCSPSDSGCDSPSLSNAGATYDHTFAKAGTFPYFCSVHVQLGMIGTVRVR